MLRLGSSEWQATQARYIGAPRAASPGSAMARYVSAIIISVTDRHGLNAIHG